MAGIKSDLEDEAPNSLSQLFNSICSLGESFLRTYFSSHQVLLIFGVSLVQIHPALTPVACTVSYSEVFPLCSAHRAWALPWTSQNSCTNVTKLVVNLATFLGKPL